MNEQRPPWRSFRYPFESEPKVYTPNEAAYVRAQTKPLMDNLIGAVGDAAEIGAAAPLGNLPRAVATYVSFKNHVSRVIHSLSNAKPYHAGMTPADIPEYPGDRSRTPTEEARERLHSNAKMSPQELHRLTELYHHQRDADPEVDSLMRATDQIVNPQLYPVPLKPTSQKGSIRHSK